MLPLRQMRLLTQLVGPHGNVLQGQVYGMLRRRVSTTCVLEIPKQLQTNPCSCHIHSRNLLETSSPRALLLSHVRWMAGHAHWKNVANIKSAVDRKNRDRVAILTNRLRSSITMGGADVEQNKELAYTLETMKKSGIPKADIQRILTKATRQDSTFGTHYQVIQGPKGVVFVLEIYTDNIKVLKFELKNISKKIPIKINEKAGFDFWFEQKGVVNVPVTSDMHVSNLDPFVEIAIECGAEDVIIMPSDEGDDTYVLKFHCAPLLVSRVAREIDETHNLAVSDSLVDLIPKVWAPIESREDIDVCTKIVDKLSSLTDVVKVFDNITVPED